MNQPVKHQNWYCDKMKIAFGLQLASKFQRGLQKSAFSAMAGATDIFLTVTGKIRSCCKALRLLPSASNSAHLPPSSFNFHDATIPQNPLPAMACGFESHHRHQKRGIRKDVPFLVASLRLAKIRFAQFGRRGSPSPPALPH